MVQKDSKETDRLLVRNGYAKERIRE